MKSLRLIRPGSPLAEQNVEVPALRTQDVLIRVKAAGICHSDAHYRAGISPVEPLPLTLGHEVAGTVEEIGADVVNLQRGDRVCLHYMTTCGHCRYCDAGSEQFCSAGQMIGKYRDGGYAEFIAVPQRSVFRLPEEISFEVGAILMCSSSTSFHALRKTRMRPGETVAIFGIGGLGFSAIQIAQAFGAREIFAVDINSTKLELARRHGATPVDARNGDAVEKIKELTAGRGVDVALELIGLPKTMKQAVQCLAIFGRAGLVGLTQKTFEVAPYTEVLNKEAEIIGVSDHLASEIPELLELARTKKLDLSGAIKTIPLESTAVNQTLDRLEKFSDDIRGGYHAVNRTFRASEANRPCPIKSPTRSQGLRVSHVHRCACKLIGGKTRPLHEVGGALERKPLPSLTRATNHPRIRRKAEIRQVDRRQLKSRNCDCFQDPLACIRIGSATGTFQFQGANHICVSSSRGGITERQSDDWSIRVNSRKRSGCRTTSVNVVTEQARVWGRIPRQRD